MTARAALKAATAGPHDRLDDLFSRFDLAVEEQYRAFLIAHAAAFLPVEDALTKAGAQRLFPDWPAMQRGPLLRDDLARLDAPVPMLQTAPAYRNDPELCGGLYVLEGSRLGGAFLRRAVGAGLPAAFLSQRAARPWPKFVAQIEQLLIADVDRSTAAQSAAATFDVFLSAAYASGMGGDDRND